MFILRASTAGSFTRRLCSPPLCLEGRGCGGPSLRLRPRGDALPLDTECRVRPAEGRGESDCDDKGGPRGSGTSTELTPQLPAVLEATPELSE